MGAIVPNDEQRMFEGEIETIIRNFIEVETGRDVIGVDLFLEEDDNRVGALIKFRQE